MPNNNEPARVDRPARGDEQRDGNNDSSRPARKYVLFADGTGAAFTTQESNIWRLYEALDRTKPDQVAYYIKGVGTAGWRPLAALDGATGIGVPSNVRTLYRFLCWNWQPGDEIYIFGFSRGSFTARTLAALIATQGLVPATIDDVPVSHEEMQRNAIAAWRAYRRQTVPWCKSLPTIWLARIVRDIVLAVCHFILRHRSYSKVRKKMDNERQNVRIKFLGLFDTVEAFGVPVEELRTAIDWAIWPISFRNRVLSEKVACARHALSLDDERTTFHPIRIDHKMDSERIKEVWFTGVHLDVGGGYPNGTLSYVPLVWMAEQVGNDLRFQPGSIEHFRAYQSAIGPMHDSRSGAAIMYRYGPRPIGEDANVDGGPPVVHFSVVERMLHGCDNYAPIMLPTSAKVLMPDGSVMALTQEETRKAMKSAYATSAKVQDARTAAAAEAFVKMKPPDGKMVGLALDTVWWRRFAYFSLLGTIALLAAWPWVARTVVGILSGPTDNVHLGGVSALAIISSLDSRLRAVIESTAGLLQGFLPSYAEPWLKITVFYPIATTIVVALAGIAWRMNAFLGDRIHERARLAWNRPHRMVAAAVGPGNWLLKIGRFMRLYAWPLRMAFTNVALPAIFLTVIFGLALLAAGRSYFNWRAGTGDLCERAGSSLTAVGDQPVPVPPPFDTKKLCWGSGLWVEKGRKYRIWIAVKDPWFDRTIMSGANGFKLYGFSHVVGLPLRRWYRADWFQPVLRIGANGDAELPLEEINVMPADDFPRPRNPTDRDDKEKRPVRIEDTDEFAKADSDLRRNWREFGTFEPIPNAALPAARDVWRKQGLADLMVAEFVAPESGEVFLYVNDAIQFFPFLGPFELFYNNNSGSAQVQLQRMPLPPPGK
jgi:uncharacterized protein (DUF2235 family)